MNSNDNIDLKNVYFAYTHDKDLDERIYGLGLMNGDKSKFKFFHNLQKTYDVNQVGFFEKNSENKNDYLTIQDGEYLHHICKFECNIYLKLDNEKIEVLHIFNNLTIKSVILEIEKYSKEHKTTNLETLISWDKKIFDQQKKLIKNAKVIDEEYVPVL